MAEEAEAVEEEVSLLRTPEVEHTLQLQHSTPLRAVTLVADASWRPGRAFHHTRRPWHFGSSGLVFLIAPLRAVTSLQLKRPTAASTRLKGSTIETAVSLETGIIPEIVSKTAVQTPRASMSLRDTRPIGTAIGTGIATIGGMVTVAVSLTARGSSTTSDSIPTIIRIPTDTHTMSTRMIITRSGTKRAFTRAMRITTVQAPTILPVNPPTPPLRPPRSN